MKTLIALLLSATAYASPQKSWFRGFCARYLIADDPYQYEGVKVETLEDFVQRLNDKIAWIEMRARLSDPATPQEEKDEINRFFQSEMRRVP